MTWAEQLEPLIKATHPSLSRLYVQLYNRGLPKTIPKTSERGAGVGVIWNSITEVWQKSLGEAWGELGRMSLVKDWDATTPRLNICSEIVNLLLWDSMDTMVRLFHCKKFNIQKRKIRHKKNHNIRFYEENSHFLLTIFFMLNLLSHVSSIYLTIASILRVDFFHYYIFSHKDTPMRTLLCANNVLELSATNPSLCHNTPPFVHFWSANHHVDR